MEVFSPDRYTLRTDSRPRRVSSGLTCDVGRTRRSRVSLCGGQRWGETRGS